MAPPSFAINRQLNRQNTVLLSVYAWRPYSNTANQILHNAVTSVFYHKQSRQSHTVLHSGGVLTGGVHVMSAGLGLRLWLGLCHHGGAERVHHSWLAGPRGGLGNVSRRPRGGAWAARVKGWGAAMETSPVVSTAPNTAVAQVHWQSLLWKGGGDVTERIQIQSQKNKQEEPFCIPVSL